MNLVSLETKEKQEMMDLKDHKVYKDPPVLMVPLVNGVPLDHQEMLVKLVLLDQLVKPERRDEMVNQVEMD